MLDCFKKEILLDQFSCERLKNDRNNKALINGFSCDRNPNLACYLKTNAWHEDNHNHRAVYLIKEGNKIVMYFSLQCGILIKCHKKEIGGIVNTGSCDKPVYAIDTDKIEVNESLPAIEMAHFCVNDSYRKKKKKWDVKHGNQTYRVGAYCFYKYIAPLIIEMAEISGLRYIYLFSAEHEYSTELKNYYARRLNFKIMDDMACIRSEYDADLECMTIKVEDLIRDTKRFNQEKP